jgi:hypothetical protein
VRALVRTFVTALNAGDLRRLDSLFAPDDGDGDVLTPSFQWYSTDGPGRRIGDRSKDRSTLLAYFAARHRAGERLRVTWLSRGGPSYGYFHFSFRLVRQARDLPATRFEGKGAATCAGGGVRLAVWSMARKARVR